MRLLEKRGSIHPLRETEGARLSKEVHMPELHEMSTPSPEAALLSGAIAEALLPEALDGPLLAGSKGKGKGKGKDEKRKKDRKKGNGKKKVFIVRVEITEVDEDDDNIPIDSLVSKRC